MKIENKFIETTDFDIYKLEEIKKIFNIPKNLKAYKLYSGLGYDGFNMIFTKIDDEKTKTIDIKNTCMRILLNNKEDRLEDRYEEKLFKGKDFYACSIYYNDRLNFHVFTNNIEDFKKRIDEIKFSPNQLFKDGIYKISHSTLSGSYLERIKPNGEIEDIILNDDLFKMITTEISEFNKKEEIYKKNNIDYKRGILLYGLPGNGKTLFLKTLLRSIKAVSILVDCQNYNQIEFIEELLRDNNFKNKLKILIFEDIDRVSSGNRSMILNLIDGIIPIKKTIFIATTNFPEKLDIGLVNRPSRFDSFFKINNPNRSSRKKLILNFFPDIAKKEMDWALEHTNTYRGCYFKELFLITKIHECSLKESIERLNTNITTFNEFSSKGKSYIG